MRELLEAVVDLLDEHWVKFVTATAFMAVGWYFGRRRARTEWSRKEFLERLNVSLNLIQDGKLRIRTLLEKSCQAVFLNTVAVESVLAAAHRTSEEDPILPLPRDEYWFYLNAVLNEVSEKFAEGQLRRDMGKPVTVATYLICLTCECDGAMKTRKVRAMLVQKRFLERFPADAPAFESPTHTTRWRTLSQLAATYRTEPFKFLEVEVCV